MAMSRLLLWSALPLALSSESPACAVGGDLSGCTQDETAASLGLLQMDSAKHRAAASRVSADATSQGRGKEDLVFMHIPYNFGHTIEKVAAFGNGEEALGKYVATETALEGSAKFMPTEAQWQMVNKRLRPNAQVWGHLNPDLFQTSKVTGCPLFFTPPQYWPTEVAEAYFGNRTVFGMLRDPYERLVAMFRGNFGDYGGSYPEFFEKCDVNGAVRKMMTDYLAGDKYGGSCCFVPQAEFFDGPFGISLAVDNRRFPDSANEVFAQNGYSDVHINTEDVLHVTGCPEVWSGDLDCETKALVKQVYQRDFQLLCERFGYCDKEENCCISGVPMMCPSNLTEKGLTATHCT